ncbi:MAG: proprotein convertase P-domain-containing protein [Sphingobacteriales bacterium]|nr:proprotein convertase P-domain-containing protein [Sphingobacteriales bacterium]
MKKNTVLILVLWAIAMANLEAQTCNDLSFGSITASPTSVCAGQNTNLTATLNSTYQVTFTGNGGAMINDNAAATPSPLTLTVLGLPASGVTVASITLNGLTHTLTQDIDIYVQSPTATNVVLMSDIPDNSGVIDVDITLQDGGSPFPADIITGTYAPANQDGGDPDNAPGGAGMLLSAFTGNANGTWNLFINDDTNTNTGTLESWSITFNVPTSTGISYQWSSNNGTSINNATTAAANSAPTTNTTYSVTATGIGGCTATGSVSVTATALPTVNDPTDQSVCAGSNTTAVSFSGSGGATFSWTNNTPSIGLAASGTGNIAAFSALNSGTSPITATITVTPSIGGACSGTPQTFTITVNPVPTATIALSESSNATPNGNVCSGESITLIASGGISYNWSNGGGTNSFINDIPTFPSETYTVTVTAIGGCTATASRTVTANSLPTVTITPTSPTICVGSSTALTASGGTTYTWSASGGGNIVSGGNSATPTVNAAGSYSVTATTAGCTATNAVVVTATNPPNAGVAQSALSVCNNSTTPVGLFSLLSNAQSGGVWTVASGSPASGTFNASNGTFTPNGNAVGTFTFTYTVTGAAGCPGTDSETVTVILTGAVSAGTASAPQSACVNSTNAISLLNLLTEETSGGVWTVASGSPASGTFNATNGTFTPNGNAKALYLYLYRYRRIGLSGHR